jgi:hypothetical protein
MDEVLHGAWWAPETPHVRATGSLRRVGDGWQLSLIGTLLVNVGGGVGLHLVPPHAIWGACHEKPYTLLGCYVEAVHGPGLQATGGEGDQFTMQWRVGRLVRGGHVTEETRFRVRVSR